MNELDREEQELLDTFEAGEWQAVREPNRLLELRRYAEAKLVKDRQITLDVSSVDLANIQAKATEAGIPYQTLISNILHKYVTGRLVERR